MRRRKRRMKRTRRRGRVRMGRDLTTPATLQGPGVGMIIGAQRRESPVRTRHCPVHAKLG